MDINPFVYYEWSFLQRIRRFSQRNGLIYGYDITLGYKRETIIF